MNIGIFGGTFNPPHNGHVIVADVVREKLSLSKIYFVPSFISPHKQLGEEELADHRLAMMNLAVKGNTAFEVCDFEIRQRETSYTINTLRYFQHTYPNSTLYLLVGMDNYLTFHQWNEYRKILEVANLVVMNRPNISQQYNASVEMINVIFVTVPHVDISSSDIRKKILEGKSINKFVSPEVENYINSHALYRAV